MKSPFGRKLFRLFLMFSLVPSVLLAVIGYLVTIETFGITSENAGVLPNEFTNYYSKIISDRIYPYLRDDFDDRHHLLVDFSMLLCNSKIEWVKSETDFSQDIIEAVASAAISRSDGTIEVEGIFVQYASLDDSTNCLRVAGLVHDSTFGSLITSLQNAHAKQQSYPELIRRYGLFAGVLFLILSATSVILAYYFSSRVANGLSKPIVALRDASRKIADGRFDSEVEIASNDELGELVDSFNRMARQLSSLTGKLAQSERVAAWRNIAQRFAHDLKNPLQPITVSLYRIEKLLKDKDMFDIVKEPLRAASEELSHLTTLANRFSHLAKLPPPKLEQINMCEFLKSLAELYSESLDDYDLVLDLPENPIMVSIDPAYFREALHNLLRNSIEASSEGGKIILRLTVRHELIRISVQDHGKGMSPDLVRSARSPYFTTKEQGKGMGLAVVEKVVDELGGQLIIESSPGEGTTAIIVLKDDSPNVG